MSRFVARIAAVALFTACPLVHAQDATAGKAIYAQCAACHTTDDTSAVAPTLKGVLERKAGSVADFRYSRAMKAADFAWDAAKLDAYLAEPQKVVPGNVMPFSGIPDAKDRANLVAYLGTLR